MVPPVAFADVDASPTWAAPKPIPHAQTQSPSRLLIGSTKFEPLDGIMNTGGAGFIGSWVTRHLAVTYQNSYNITCFDKLDSIASENNGASIRGLPNFNFVKGDITDMRAVKSALETYNNSFNDPFTFTHNNVIGTHILLEAVRSYGKISRFIHVSTDEVYGETNGVFATESHPLGPTNPYSASKAAAEMYVNAYYKSFDIPVIIVRSNNVYGPCQYPEKIIPVFCKLAMGGKNLTIQGNGKNTRRYLYAGDAADAFDTVLHRGIDGEIYNIDSEYEVDNLSVASRILDHFGRDFDGSIAWIPDRPFNDSEYRVDGTKLESLGWAQRTSFDEGMPLLIGTVRTSPGGGQSR